MAPQVPWGTKVPQIRKRDQSNRRGPQLGRPLGQHQDQQRRHQRNDDAETNAKNGEGSLGHDGNSLRPPAPGCLRETDIMKNRPLQNSKPATEGQNRPVPPATVLAPFAPFSRKGTRRIRKIADFTADFRSDRLCLPVFALQGSLGKPRSSGRFPA